jgi:hypothetical protein
VWGRVNLAGLPRPPARAPPPSAGDVVERVAARPGARMLLITDHGVPASPRPEVLVLGLPTRPGVRPGGRLAALLTAM